MTTIYTLIAIFIILIVISSITNNNVKIVSIDITTIPLHIKLDKDKYDTRTRIEGSNKRYGPKRLLCLEKAREISVTQIAKQFDCQVNETKEFYFKKLRAVKLKNVLSVLEDNVFEKQKHEQAVNFFILKDSTPSALLEEWTIEYIENKEYQYRKRTNLDIIKDIMALYPECGIILAMGNQELKGNYLDENPDMIDIIMNEFAHSDEPAERCRLKAIEVRWNDDDFKEAFRIIDLGLEFNDPYTEPFLYSLKVDCFEKLSNYTLALENMNKAIESIQKNLPDNFYQISCFYKTRSEIKDKLSDVIGAMQDREKAEIFDAKYEANKTADDNNNDLPF